MRLLTMRNVTMTGVLCLAGCQSVYYGAMEKLGQHKRDILVSRVESARDEQQEAKTQFQNALEQFTAVVGVQGGDLRVKYDQLATELERCEADATRVRDRISGIEDVSGALFEEWERELTQYSSADLRRRSQEQLRTTQDRYDQLLRTMKRAEGRMEPVLVAFRDHVLYLKHNLNAQAIASLQGEVVALESDIAALVEEMEAAIAEADSFIKMMGSA